MMRERLLNRRAAETFEFTHITPAGVPQVFTATLGYYEDGRIGEVFLTCGRTGTDLDVATRDSAIALSLALQHGCPLQVVAPAFLRNARGVPEGPLGTLVDILTGAATS